MNRLTEKIKTAKRKKEKLFCAFLTLGYPDLDKTKKLIPVFEEEGVDILELGFPFSDPLADGPTIQFSSEQALRRGVGLEDAFRIVTGLRKKNCQIPIIFFTYFNPVFHYGADRFLKRAKQSGFDGVIIPDLPPDQETGFRQKVNRVGLSQVFLIAPTTDKKRSQVIAHQSQGFIYYVSLRGVTGARRELPEDIRRHLRVLKSQTDKPILVGFGVSTPGQAACLAGMADGVIVGSAIISRLRQSKGRIEPVRRYVRAMVRHTKGR